MQGAILPSATTRVRRLDRHAIDLPLHAPMERMAVERDVGLEHPRTESLHRVDLQRGGHESGLAQPGRRGQEIKRTFNAYAR